MVGKRIQTILSVIPAIHYKVSVLYYDALFVQKEHCWEGWFTFPLILEPVYFQM